ncbi:MAG: 2-phospho-L-lactate transferase [Rhodospirillales bacterium]|nr:2-phospho-L-lactate transferase [Rhodospirillales bacterium]
MKILALSGGIGGAKLALGLSHVLPAGALSVIANTGDDFTHLGLRISPDIDTLCYTLGGLDNPVLGWGRADESWAFMETLGALGGETWFRLGDRDLALHVWRTAQLAAGATLSAVTASVAARFGIASAILPMSDDPVATRVATTEGTLDFQEYFVHRQCRPVVRGLEFAGAAQARIAPGAQAALAAPDLAAIVICPSNPFISIDPILAVPGLRAALRAAPAPVIAVSPLIGGKAVKGPTAKMMQEMGMTVDAAAVAAHYGDLLDGFVLDSADAATRIPGVASIAAPTLMTGLAEKIALARAVLDFAAGLRA